MRKAVSWVNELADKAGKLETFRELMEEMVAGTRQEPGTLVYEWYISRNWAGRFMDLVDITRVEVYGAPNAPARALLDRLGATSHSAWGSFSRL